MKPKLYQKTSREGEAGSIIDCIESIDCSKIFGKHIGKSQSDQKVIVQSFQDMLCYALSDQVPSVNWQTEYKPSNSQKDSIDIFGSNSNLCVAIELDKHRADQVAKKFVSRSSLLIGKTVFYISLCYPGTERMNANECIKFFGYCSNLSLRMGNQYAGFIVE